MYGCVRSQLVVIMHASFAYIACGAHNNLHASTRQSMIARLGVPSGQLAMLVYTVLYFCSIHAHYLLPRPIRQKPTVEPIIRAQPTAISQDIIATMQPAISTATTGLRTDRATLRTGRSPLEGCEIRPDTVGHPTNLRLSTKLSSVACLSDRPCH